MRTFYKFCVFRDNFVLEKDNGKLLNASTKKKTNKEKRKKRVKNNKHNRSKKSEFLPARRHKLLGERRRVIKNRKETNEKV
jgi:hypothetical protein